MPTYSVTFTFLYLSSNKSLSENMLPLYTGFTYIREKNVFSVVLLTVVITYFEMVYI